MLECKDIRPRNSDGKPHGYWVVYWTDGTLWYKGNFLNGNRHGYWELYHPNGNLAYNGNYLNDEEHGYCEWYWDNGKLNNKRFYARM